MKSWRFLSFVLVLALSAGVSLGACPCCFGERLPTAQSRNDARATDPAFAPFTDEKVQAMLHDHPLNSTEDFAMVELERDAERSLHIAQIRDKEQLHRHNFSGAKAMLWKGTGTLQCGIATTFLKEKDIFEIPKGQSHLFANTSEKPAVILAIYSPPLQKGDRENL